MQVSLFSNICSHTSPPTPSQADTCREPPTHTLRHTHTNELRPVAHKTDCLPLWQINTSLRKQARVPTHTYIKDI